MIFSLSLSVFASIETTIDSKGNDFLFMAKGRIDNSSKTFHVDPLYLDRDISIMSNFSSLPGNIVTTLEQFCFNWDVNNSFSINSRHFSAGSNSAKRYEHHEATLSKKTGDSVETFFKAKNSLDHNDSIEAGAKTELKTTNWTISGEVAYEDFMASNIASPGIRAAVQGLYNFDYSISSQLKLAWQYFDDYSNSYLSNLSEKAAGNLYSPKLSNMNILNISLACMTSKKMFMSVDYYYYLQDKLKVQTATDNYSILADSATSGSSKELGQELDIRAVFNNSKNWTSRLFAGWFEPGNGLNPGEDSKTFEIRGEIVVNF